MCIRDRPRAGPIFDSYRKTKSAYRSEIRKRQRDEDSYYTNELHDALLQKQGVSFWKRWNWKFDPKKKR